VQGGVNLITLLLIGLRDVTCILCVWWILAVVKSKQTCLAIFFILCIADMDPCWQPVHGYIDG